MHPVEPSTIVRGPDAFTMSFMTSADSHPWQVRCPEVKYSSIVTRLTPRNGSRICVALLNIVVSAMVASPLFPNAQPVGLRVGLADHGGRVAKVHRLVDILQDHFATAQTADEGQERRPPIGIVQGRADLVGDHARPERRTERIVAVDDAHRLRLRQRRYELLGRERPEPA